MINSIEKINDDNHELLFKIRMSFGKKKYLEIIRNKYELDENDNLINLNPCFFLLKPSKIDPKMNKYRLNPGEIVKIGRITMRIRDIKFNNQKNTNTLNETKDNNNKKENNMTRLETSERKMKEKKNGVKKNIKKMTQKDIFSKLEKMKRVCRICYLEEDENNLEDPLVQPCKCTGSVKFIHLSCLRKWISTRSCVKIDTTSECCIFLIKPVICELCKAKFPDFIKYEKHLLPVIDFSEEFENFLTLESLTLDRQNNKFIYVISLNKEKKIKIGRGHEAKVILSDISVSRIHCIMTVDKNQVFIEDNESKFGTLILVQSPNIILSENLPLYIQVGRTYFNCQLTKPFSLFNCCDIGEKNNINFYYNQNAKYIKDNLGMVVKPDLSEIDSDNEDDLINNTCEQKSKLDVIDQLKFSNIKGKISINEGDKMSDNEYFLLKRNKKKKIIKKEMIYDEEEKKGDLIDNEKENANEENENNNNDNNNDEDFDDENNESNDTASLADEDDDEDNKSEGSNNKKKKNRDENNNNENNEDANIENNNNS